MPPICSPQRCEVAAVAGWTTLAVYGLYWDLWPSGLGVTLLTALSRTCVPGQEDHCASDAAALLVYLQTCLPMLSPV